MQRISDAYQRHHRFKPGTFLFGTVSKTPRKHYSKLTQSDCMFDLYATILEQYRARFSTLDVGAKRYHPKLETFLYIIFLFFISFFHLLTFKLNLYSATTIQMISLIIKSACTAILPRNQSLRPFHLLEFWNYQKRRRKCWRHLIVTERRIRTFR